MYAKVNENNDLWMLEEFEDYNVKRIVHVHPANEQHVQEFCPCNPVIKEIEGGFKFMHKAFDGRDVLDDVAIGDN